jgi:hypothetical protein
MAGLASRVVNRVGYRQNKPLPAQEPGGRYKGNTRLYAVFFVAAAPSRKTRDGAGMFFFEREYYRTFARTGNGRCLFSEPYHGTAIRIPAGSK